MRVNIDYRNYRGEYESRTIVPTGKFHVVKDGFHRDPTWCIEAFCESRGAVRNFAMNRILGWREIDAHLHTSA